MPYVGAMPRKSHPDEPKTPDDARRRAPEDGGEPQTPGRLDPTRYGDWEIDGRCIDF